MWGLGGLGFRGLGFRGATPREENRMDNKIKHETEAEGLYACGI